MRLTKDEEMVRALEAYQKEKGIRHRIGLLMRVKRKIRERSMRWLVIVPSVKLAEDHRQYIIRSSLIVRMGLYESTRTMSWRQILSESSLASLGGGGWDRQDRELAALRKANQQHNQRLLEYNQTCPKS